MKSWVKGAAVVLALAVLAAGAAALRRANSASAEMVPDTSIDDILSLNVPERFTEEPIVSREKDVVIGYQYRRTSEEVTESGAPIQEEYLQYYLDTSEMGDAVETMSDEEYEKIHAEDDLFATVETDGTTWFITVEDATIRYEDEEEAALVEQNGFARDSAGYFTVPEMTAVARCRRNGHEIEVTLENSYDSLSKDQEEEFVEMIRNAGFQDTKAQ